MRIVWRSHVDKLGNMRLPGNNAILSSAPSSHARQESTIGGGAAPVGWNQQENTRE